MIKKLLLTLSFIVLATITFNGTTYAAQEGETIVVSEELFKLNKLYIEGVITEEEFSKAKSILLDPDSGTTKKKKRKWWQFQKEEKKPELTAVERRDLEKLEEKKVILKKQKLTAAERKQLENELIEAEKVLKEQLRAEKRAERERIKQASLDEEVKMERACEEDPQSKECRSAGASLKRLLKKLKIIDSATSKKEKRERELEKQASLEEQERNKAERAERAAAKRAEAAAKKAEKKKLKAELKKACSEDPDSKACKEGKRKKFFIF